MITQIIKPVEKSFLSKHRRVNPLFVAKIYQKMITRLSSALTPYEVREVVLIAENNKSAFTSTQLKAIKAAAYLTYLKMIDCEPTALNCDDLIHFIRLSNFEKLNDILEYYRLNMKSYTPAETQAIHYAFNHSFNKALS